MSEERQSKLQRWILKRCLLKGKGLVERQVLLKEYMENKKLDLSSAEVILTGSLKNLRDKELVELENSTGNTLFTHKDIEALGLGEAFDESLHKVKYVSLTEEGEKKAKEIVLDET